MAMVLVFFLARVVLMVCFAYQFTLGIWAHEFTQTSILLNFCVYPSLLIVYVLNFYWFFKMARGALRLMLGKPVEEKAD